MRLKQNFAVLLAAGALALTACTPRGAASSTTAPTATATPQPTEAPADSENTDTSVAADTAAEPTGGKILIAYFTAAENSGVDAVASASYSTVEGTAIGRVRALADFIQADVGGDLFSIRTVETYPVGINDVIDQAAQEQAANARPELADHIDNLDDYDTIFIGYPNWWADLPMPVYSFFDEYDLSGKTIIPFNTHNGSRLSRTVQTIQELEPNATVVTDAFTVHESQVPDAKSDIDAWLTGIGFTMQ